MKASRYSGSEDINWMGNLGGETKSEPKKGFFSFFSRSPEEKARRKAEKARRKAAKKRRKSQKRIANNMRNMEKRRIECENKGMRLSLNGEDCEPITPPGSPTASGYKRPSIAEVGADEYAKSLFKNESGPSIAEVGAEGYAKSLFKGGRKRRRKTRRKKKRKSRRKSRKRRRKRKTKKRR
tara:strand:+ start:10023 stop:10565 length:543 start_codon:yes stop_codon:yes gene_type:complete